MYLVWPYLPFLPIMSLIWIGLKIQTFPTSVPLYMLFFFLSAIFAHLSSLAECHFFQKAFCDHAIQSNRVLSHTPLTFSWFALFRIFITVGYYHQYLLGFLPCFCLHLTECYIWRMQAVTEHGHCLFTCGFLFIT